MVDNVIGGGQAGRQEISKIFSQGDIRTGQSHGKTRGQGDRQTSGRITVRQAEVGDK